MIAPEIAYRSPLDACVARARDVLSAAATAAEARRAAAFDPLRGLYVTEHEVRDTLAAMGGRAPVPASQWLLPEVSGITRDPALHDAVAIAVAAQLVPRLDRVFGYLHDDLTRTAFTVGLAIETAGVSVFDFDVDATLVRLAILTVSSEETGPARRLVVTRGFLAFLAGDVRLDPAVRHCASIAAAGGNDDVLRVHGAPRVFWGGEPDDLASAACAYLTALSRGYVRVAAGADARHVAIAAREAVLRHLNLAIACETADGARAAYDATAGLPLTVAIEAAGGILGDAPHTERVSPKRTPAGTGTRPTPLPYGRRVVPRHAFGDLILPAPQLRALTSIAERYWRRDTVLDDWGLEAGSSLGGVRALFAGPPGTGKTFAAEVLAHELERDLYVIDVSAIVSKYIGETEKALARVFAEAAAAGVVLFFDEADALFGKRTEASDAHDRYANIETAFLLQALDRYPDIAILATNLVANVDDALLRRIDVRVDFPMPAVPERRLLWRRAFARAPLDGIDVDELAAQLAAGGRRDRERRVDGCVRLRGRAAGRLRWST